MKKLLLLLLLSFFLTSFAAWAMSPVFLHQVSSGSSGEDKWVGFPNSSGTPSSPVGSFVDYGSTADLVYTRTWTATENGTIKQVNLRMGSTVAGLDTYAWFVVYNGTTLVGKAAFGTQSTNAWTGYETIIVEGGQSLDFSTNDVLYFGLAYDSADGRICRDDGDTANAIEYENDIAFESSPPTPVAWETSANKGLGSILNYQTR